MSGYTHKGYLQFPTALRHPTLARELLRLHREKRITTGLLKESLADPKLARAIADHEMWHDILGPMGVFTS